MIGILSNVTDMELMFLTRSGSIHRFNQPLNNWDVSNVTNMAWMFGVQFGTNGLGDFNQHLNNWDVSNVTNMSGMFKAAQKI